MKVIVLYYLILNLLLFTAMGMDKYRAVHHKWRIPEAYLFIEAFLGGSLGGFLGMFIFRHKIRKPKFYFMFTLALLLHICLLINCCKLTSAIDIFK